jgi:hypothetical protein
VFEVPYLIRVLVEEDCPVKFLLSFYSLKLARNQIFLNVSFEVVERLAFGLCFCNLALELLHFLELVNGHLKDVDRRVPRSGLNPNFLKLLVVVQAYLPVIVFELADWSI